MSASLTYYCWRCYGENDRPSGACINCGGLIEPPRGTSYGRRLVWALDHPVAETRVNAARILGERREQRAVKPLRRLALESTSEPYLAAVALRSLVAIEGVDALRAQLHELAAGGPVQLRQVAAEALANEDA